MTIYEIIDSIASIGSTNAKLEILQKNSSNGLLKRSFYYAYNPRFNFWIKPESVTEFGVNEIDEHTFSVLDKLINREYTGHAARDFISAYMKTLTSEAQEVLSRIMNHDLRCGASDTLAMKVWKGLVPEYPVMLCSKFDTKAKKHLDKVFESGNAVNVSVKMDGGRLLTKVALDGTVTYMSRNGSTLNLFGAFDKQFSKFPGMVFDGELVINNADGTPDRKKSNGIYNKAVRGTISREEAALFSVFLWDVVPETEYVVGLGTQTYATRWNLLQVMQETVFEGSNVRVVEGINVKSMEECLEFYESMRKQGQEGAVIKVLESVWEDKRSKNCIKLKAENSADLLCIAVEPGTGKYAGMIGALTCKTSCGKLVVNVGTGLKDEDRQKDPEEFLNKILEIAYNEVIMAKGKTTKSLFLPVYKQVRADKKTANSLEELA